MALVTGSIPVVKTGDGIVVSILRQCVVVSRVYSLIVQLVEHRTVNPYVAGSSPARGAKHGTDVHPSSVKSPRVQGRA